MTREHVVMLAELRDAARAFHEDPQADRRLAKAIEALAVEALKDEPAFDTTDTPTPVNDNADHDAGDETPAPARPKTFDEL